MNRARNGDYTAIIHLATYLFGAAPDDPGAMEFESILFDLYIRQVDSRIACILGMFLLRTNREPVNYRQSENIFSFAVDIGDEDSLVPLGISRLRLNRNAEEVISLLDNCREDIRSKDEDELLLEYYLTSESHYSPHKALMVCLDMLYADYPDAAKNIRSIFRNCTISDEGIEGFYRGACEILLKAETPRSVQRRYFKVIEECLSHAENGRAYFALAEYMRNLEGKLNAKIIEHVHMSADMGFYPAIRLLADMYRTGVAELLPTNKAKAFELYTQCNAIHSTAEVSYVLGMAYMYGIGVNKDLGKGHVFLEQAKTQGSTAAVTSLAVELFMGGYVDKNPRLAVEMLHTVADDVTAMKMLGLCYSEGIGVEKNTDKALYYMRKAADCGDTESLRNLAVKYFSEETTISVNNALKCLSVPCSNGDDEAFAILYDVLQSKKYANATQEAVMEYLSALAESGNAKAVMILAKRAKSTAAALRYLERAIELGETTARTQRALLKFGLTNMRYYAPTLGLRELTELAKSHDMEALNALADVYMHGYDVVKDEHLAFHMYYELFKAVDTPKNRRELVKCYLYGYGVVRDICIARKLAMPLFAANDAYTVELFAEYFIGRGMYRELRCMLHKFERANLGWAAVMSDHYILLGYLKHDSIAEALDRLRIRALAGDIMAFSHYSDYYLSCSNYDALNVILHDFYRVFVMYDCYMYVQGRVLLHEGSDDDALEAFENIAEAGMTQGLMDMYYAKRCLDTDREMLYIIIAKAFYYDEFNTDVVREYARCIMQKGADSTSEQRLLKCLLRRYKCMTGNDLTIDDTDSDNNSDNAC